MCYSGQSVTKQRLDYAKQRGDLHEVERLERLYFEMDIFNNPRYYVSAFAHPPLLAYTNEDPVRPQALTWGLIPSWTKSAVDAKKFSNQTLNARGETIWEKPSFKFCAKNKRCLIYLDAFYEHHHVGKETIPFRIFAPDETPLIMAGLWDEWADKNTGEVFRTCTIVTTQGNALLSKIHNNTKAEMGPRMPVILTKETQDQWLGDCKTEQDKQRLQNLIKPYSGELRAYTVGRINGKNAMANTPAATEEVKYPEFALDLPSAQ